MSLVVTTVAAGPCSHTCAFARYFGNGSRPFASLCEIAVESCAPEAARSIVEKFMLYDALFRNIAIKPAINASPVTRRAMPYVSQSFCGEYT